MSINLNNTTPGAPSGAVNVQFLSDGSGNVSANVPTVGGDTGSGGTAGIVPAPGAGDAAAGKFLRADGTWSVPAGGGGGGGGASLPPWFTFTAPPTTGWTSDNIASPSYWDTTAGYPYIHGAREPSSDQARSIWRSVPGSTPWTVSAAIKFDLSGRFDDGTDAKGNAGVGLMLGDGSGKQIMFRYSIAFNTTSGILTVDKWSSNSSYNSSYQASAAQYFPADLVFLRITDNGTNLIFSGSIDGNHWIQFYSVSRTDYLTSGPTVVGVHIGNYDDGDSAEVALVSWQVS